MLGTVQTHQGECVVLQLTAFYESVLGAQNLINLHIRNHCLDDVQAMGANVCHSEGRACLLRVKTPLSSSIGLFNLVVVAAKCEGHVDHADVAQIAVLNHLASLLNHLMAGVAVGDADNQILLLCQSNQLLAFLGAEAQRLLAYNMDAGFQSRLAHFIVYAVRGSDGNSLNAVLALCFLLEHGLVVRIAAIRINAQLSGKCHAALRIDVECACYQLEVVVAQCCGAMDVADLAALAAADHSPANRMIQNLRTVNHSHFLLKNFFYKLSVKTLKKIRCDSRQTSDSLRCA